MSEKEAFTSRLNKMELTKETYEKILIWINAELMHYNTVVRPEALYAGKCLTMAKNWRLK